MDAQDPEIDKPAGEQMNELRLLGTVIVAIILEIVVAVSLLRVAFRTRLRWMYLLYIGLMLVGAGLVVVSPQSTSNSHALLIVMSLVWFEVLVVVVMWQSREKLPKDKLRHGIIGSIVFGAFIILMLVLIAIPQRRAANRTHSHVASHEPLQLDPVELSLIVIAVGTIFRTFLQRVAHRRRWSVRRFEFLSGMFAAVVATGAGIFLFYSPRYHSHPSSGVIIGLLVVVWDFVYLYYLPHRAARKHQNMSSTLTKPHSSDGGA